MSCNKKICVSEPEKQIDSSDHPTPFNLGPMCVLMVFCVIMSLSSSLYHNWPAIEKIFIDDRVFESLCTKQQIKNAIPGFFVCDKQRDAIGDLTLYVFFSEFLAFSVCGPLADVFGVYVILMFGFTCGFFAFLLMYYLHSNLSMLKLACCFWGISGGSVIIVSVHFARMFPDTTSLADGMMIFFENVSSVVPIIIGKLMRCYKLKYYEAFGSYVIWGILPSFLLAATFIPNKILPKNRPKPVIGNLVGELKKEKLWMNLVIFSIPVTSSVFYRKMFSSYFLNNQKLIQIFPIIQLFVFVPTPFVAVLDQFLGIHATSSLLYMCYIIGFFCFLYPTRGYGMMSIMCFVIAHAAEHQIMHYISEHHPNYESTLMGISYAVVCVVGSMLERIFTLIHNRFSPGAVIYIINALLILSIIYSVYCHYDSMCASEGSSSVKRFRILFVILWLVPFLFLSIVLSIKSLYRPGKPRREPDGVIMSNYIYQKVSTISIMFYSFSFYQVCNTFLVIVSIFEISSLFEDDFLRTVSLLYFLICFFVLPQVMIFVHFRYVKKYVNISVFVVLLFIYNLVLFACNYMVHLRYFFPFFSGFMFLYGFTFFMFSQMLTFYNFQITYAERMYRTSVLHIGCAFTMFMVFRFFYNELSRFPNRYYVIWAFSTCYFLLFSAILYLYFSYEMDIPFSVSSANLCLPKGLSGDISRWIDASTFFEISTNIALTVCNFAIILNLTIKRRLHWLFLLMLLIDSLTSGSVLCPKYVNYGQAASGAVLFFSVISIAIFILLLVCRIFLSSDRFQGSLLVAVLVLVNFVVLTLSNNLCWLKVQFELQKKENCNCCCLGSDHQPAEECCMNGGCSGKEDDGPCRCLASNCEECLSGKAEIWKGCLKCIIYKCSKTTLVTPKGRKIVFSFYKTEQRMVISTYLPYFFGTFIGWILFVVYVGISRERLLFYTFL